MKKIAMVMLLWLPLVGCEQVARQKHEYVRNRGKDYLTSFVTAPLDIPPGLACPVATEHFPVPEALPTLGKLSSVSLTPPGFGGTFHES